MSDSFEILDMAYIPGKLEHATEPRHEVASGNKLYTCVVRLIRTLETLSFNICVNVHPTFRINLKHRPISFLLTVETATISLKVLGTPSCLQAM